MVEQIPLAGREGEGLVLSFPKPFLLGQIYGTSAERALDFAYDRDPNAVRKWFSGLMDQTPLNLTTLLPTAIKPLIEARANFSFSPQGD